MDIRLAKKDDLELVATIYAEAYNAVTDENWTVEAALRFVEFSYNKQPDLFFVAEDNNNIIGAAFAEINPWAHGMSLSNIELFVKPNFQKRGAGKFLIRMIISQALDNYQISEVNFMADSSRGFPFNWYKKIGMKDSSWIFMSGKPDELLDNLKNNSDK